MTYAELTAAVLGYFGNSTGDPDPNFEAFLPTIVEMGESKIYTDLRHPRMLQSDFVSNLSITSLPPYTVSSRMLEAYRLTDAKPWRFCTPEQFFGLTVPSDSKFWTLYGSELVLSQDLTDTLVFSWYEKPVPLSEDDTTALFQLYPHLFLYAALAEAARYLREPADTISVLDMNFVGILTQVRAEAWNAHLAHGQPTRITGG